jgi:hypothetical protein
MARSSVARRIKKAPTVDVDKVAKLVRLALSSDQPGEQTAAIAALKRALDIADLDLHDLADAVVAGLKPRAPEKPWGPPPPDLTNWQSMGWFCHFHSRSLQDHDRGFVADVLLGSDDVFDCGRATPELMGRLRRIVSGLQSARIADDRW